MTQATEDAAQRFSRVYEAHYWALLRYAGRRLDSEATARDVVADSFAVAWRRWDQVPSDEGVLPWLYEVAHRLIANERRRQKRAEDLLRRLREQLAAESEAETSRLRETVAAFAQLGSGDQEVLRLAAWEGLNGRALGTALGCSTTAAAVRLHRARRRLRGVMQHESRNAPRPLAQGSAIHRG